MNSDPEKIDSAMPISVNHCNGMIEKPVTRSKFKRINL